MNFTPHARSDTHLNNKPGVFLLTAPQDTGERDELIELLLDKELGANVTVWQSDIPPDREELPQLAHMSLFVIAVTENLVHGYLNHAADAVGFAWENTIPILPVYYISPGKKNESARRFYTAVTASIAGDGNVMKELDGPVHRAKDFKEQFSNKYQQLIMHDDVAEEIKKNAFYKKLFLSYRKTDKEKALEVMKAVHDLPLCQSLAIWFDDFLIAGRDFNEEIQQQLISSDAFLLTVTPSLLEMPNYVYKEEYPRAVDSKPREKIIPVQADEMDAGTFRKEYNRLPVEVPVWDEEALKEKITDALFSEEPPKEPTARQKYLLGMAYLSGIMVEKDADRAVRLITEASDEGEADAALQLAYMYLARIGVPRSNEKALRQKQRAFELAEAAADGKDEQILETAYKAAFGTDGLVLMNFAVDATDDARDICHRMRSLISLYPDGEKHSLWYANAYISEGDPHFDNDYEMTADKLTGYRQTVNEGISLVENLNNRGEDAEFLLVQGCCTLSDIEKRLGNFEEAEKQIRTAQRILIPLTEQSNNLRYRDVLSESWEQLGFIYKHQYKYKEAASAFDKVISIRDGLYSESNLPTYREGLAYAYYNYGLVEDDFNDGAEKIRKAIKLMEELISENPEDKYMKQTLDEMKSALKKQEKKPLVQKLITGGIIVAIAGVLIALIVGLVRAILD